MKISVVGIGKVGSTLAYTLAIRGLCNELVLVNRTPQIAEGDALDLQHAQSFTDRTMKVHAGGIEATTNSDVIALCASVPMGPDFRSRLSLGPKNHALFSELVPPLAEASPQAKFIVLSNPVDVMTYFTIQLSGFNWSRVIGTGTLIDSARFRTMLSEQLRIHPSDLRAYILGEHGSSQFPALSVSVCGGEHIEDRPDRRALFEQVARVGFKVFQRKGYTNYAIAMAATHIIESIVYDTCHTMPVSILVDGFLGVRDVCLSIPAVVGREGVTRVLHPELNEEEAEKFRDSAKVVRGAIDDAMQPGAAVDSA